jgi:hypothetical protein
LRKIPTIFKRDFENNPQRVTAERNPDCDWVFAGEGTATRKYDGMCCMYDGTTWFKRREVKPSQQPPEDFVLVDRDEETGKKVGWVPIGDGSEDQYFRAAIAALHPNDQHVATYELLGPKSQGNPEAIDTHFLQEHEKAWVYPDVPRSYNGLRDFLASRDIEGLVFHHPDGRMAKIKKRDYAMPRKTARFATSVP